MPPEPIPLYHFTHIDHLASITQHGLMCDTDVGERLTSEAGEPGIKVRRRQAEVDVGPRGVVGDYVPWYFAPRSPMLFRIKQGGVSSYAGRQSDLVYLYTTVEHLQGSQADLVLTDRNAAISYAEFASDPERWRADGFIDWPLMQNRYWNNNDAHPDRKERRMAECLVHRSVPWQAVLAIGVHDEAMAARVRDTIAGSSHEPRLVVRPGWYF